jgi:hypothetical protein
MKVLFVLMSVLGFSAMGYAGSNEELAIAKSTAALTEAGVDVNEAQSIEVFCRNSRPGAGGLCVTTFAFGFETYDCPGDGRDEQIAVGKKVILHDLVVTEIKDYKDRASCQPPRGERI